MRRVNSLLTSVPYQTHPNYLNLAKPGGTKVRDPRIYSASLQTLQAKGGYQFSTAADSWEPTAPVRTFGVDRLAATSRSPGARRSGLAQVSETNRYRHSPDGSR